MTSPKLASESTLRTTIAVILIIGAFVLTATVATPAAALVPHWYSAGTYRLLLALTPIVLSLFVTLALLTTRRQVVLVSLVATSLLALFILTSLIPGLLRREECLRIITQGEKVAATGECYTFVENSRVYALHIQGLVYLLFFAIINTLAGMVVVWRKSAR